MRYPGKARPSLVGAALLGNVPPVPTEPTDAVCAKCGRDAFVPGTPVEQRRDCGWCRQVEEGLAPAPSVAPEEVDFEAADQYARVVENDLALVADMDPEAIAGCNLARAYLALRPTPSERTEP